MKNFASAFFVALVLLFSQNSIAVGNAEKMLHEKLLDLSALVRSGVNFRDYSTYMPELVVLYDRYERSTPKIEQNFRLQFAKDYFLKAQDKWKRKIEAIGENRQRSADLMDKQMESDWDHAFEKLDEYANSIKPAKRAKKESSSKSN